MLYHEFEVFRRRYKCALNAYSEILAEQEELFQQTQPNAVKYDSDKVQTSYSADAFARYVQKKEERQIDERLAESKEILDKRKMLLKQKEESLRASNELWDRVYVFRFLDRRRIKWIARRTSYSEAHIYRIINAIKESLKER